MGPRSGSTAPRFSQCTLSQIEQHLSPALDSDILQKPTRGKHSRTRIFSLSRTFWCWIWQVLQGNTSCREVVHQVQALFAIFNAGVVDSGSAAYCSARRKLSSLLLERAFLSSACAAENQCNAGQLLQGRRLHVVDGSLLRLQDTEANRAAFGAPKNQFGRPGFPMMKVLALFSVASGAILTKAVGAYKESELRLLLALKSAFCANDICIGDRGFGSFLVAAWLQSIGVDLVARLSVRTRKVDFRRYSKRLGPNEALFVWKKPLKPSPVLSLKDWLALPEQITVRILRVRIQEPGWRTRELTLVTTLLDPESYPTQEILTAYLKRWRVEMCIDDLKTTLNMETLSCQSPEMVRKELLVFLITHNLLRWLMAQAAKRKDLDPERLSFKGTLDAFRQWSQGIPQVRGAGKTRKQSILWSGFLDCLAAGLLPSRPGRKEPRAIKKRSKYPSLTRHRHVYVDRWSRKKRSRIATAKKATVK